MAFPVLQASFAAGEVSPEIWGRVDLQKYRTGCSTMRNMFVSYRGGSYSRPGLKFVGQSKQAGTGLPPVLIPFQFSVNQGYVIEAGQEYFRFIFDEAYITETAKNVTAITNANPGVFTCAGHGFSSGDWVQIAGLTSTMPQISGQVFVVVSLGLNTFSLQSTLTGADVNTATYGVYLGAGATVARVYTLATPYQAADLPALKWTQSADVMSLTHPDYSPRDLARVGQASWTLTQTTFASSIDAPASASGAATNTTTGTATQYQYVVTAIDAATGEESVASPIATITDSVNISVVAGTNVISWSPVTGATYYNVYRAPPAYGADVPVGSSFGYVGQAFGLSFTDTNIVPDATKTPPLHLDPFATGSVTAISMSDYGSGILTATGGITSPTGAGFVAQAVIIGGELQWWVIANGGADYTAGDTFNITATYTSSGSTSSASGTLVLGPSTGTWPSCVAYFQQRRFYANTDNNPDTYYGSQPGAFTNMDASVPVKDDDAIVGSPWAQQVDGIQAMVPMPGGLVILTGKSAWQLSGGQSGAALTPANQFATAQAYNGCSPLIRPLTINYDILYVQEKGSIVRDLSYNYFVNIYTGTDMTVLSNHLFQDHTILRWDWAEEPNKLVWAVRDDGIMLCMTYLKEQDVYAWSRHDTNGLFQSVACISEPPVNAPYVVVKRLIQTSPAPTWAYYIERMDNRIWDTIDDCWCVDSGLEYPMPAPAATLTASAATGGGNVTSYVVTYGGSGYTAPTGRLVSATGSGAQVTLTVSGGVIVDAQPTYGTQTGSGYTGGTQLVITDATGSGAVVQPIVTNYATFEADAAVFGSAAAGDVIRMGGGVATIVQVNSNTSVVADITVPITAIILDDPLNTPAPAASGTWTLTTPITTVYGLDHLEGMEVAIVADGGVVTPQTVSGGTIELPEAASSILVGLPFTCQLQTLYLETGQQPTVQGRRKNIMEVVVRVFKSRGWEIGANQPDASTQPDGANVPWTNMVQVQQRGPLVPPGYPIPLLTGDDRVNITAGWDIPGQVAIQQTQPLPLNLIAVIPNVTIGDTPEVNP